MPVCQYCPGREFSSGEALVQHRTAKHSIPAPTPPNGSTSSTSAPKPRHASHVARRRDIQIQRDLHRGEPIHTINATELQPSTAPVSSKDPHELICSYSWRATKRSSRGFHVPGHAPHWQELPLPQVVPQDRDMKDVAKSLAGWQKTKYPFEQVFQATQLMNPEFRFSDVDVLTTRNSLRKLLDFCCNRSQDSFRINLTLVRNTLLIEQHDNKFMLSQNLGWGHGFERTFTKFPPGLEDSTSHDRFLRYPVGALNCIVGFEVDACYKQHDETSEEIDTQGLKSLTLQEPSLASSPPESSTSNSNPPGQPTRANVMQQSTAAELKSSSKNKSLNSVLPQLWFGRTPWLITGHHIAGTFDKISVTDAAAHFERWETERQLDLQKLATVLVELRDAVRKNEGKGCAAVYEKGVGARVIKVCALDKSRKVPDDIVRSFWN